MRFLYAFIALLFLSLPCHAQTGNACSSNTAAATGTIQSYAYCQPGVIDGRVKGGWIVLNRTGDQGNTEKQCYSPGNVFIQNGILTIEDRALSSTCQYYPAVTGVGSETNAFTSAFVQWNTFSFTGGDLLVRMKGPGNSPNGGWPAVWLLGANCELSSKVTADNTTFGGQTCNWPNPGSEEIDLFEQSSNAALTITNCNLFATTSTQNSYTISNSSLAFHIYEVRWISGTSINFYYDGALQAGCAITVAVPSTPMFLQMDIAMNSTATSTGLPTDMQIDWVKVCQPSPCNGNGGNIIFYDDFVTPTVLSVSRPISRMARIGGTGVAAPMLNVAPAPAMFAKKEDQDQ